MRNIFIIIFFGITSFLFTVFVFLNTYELLANKDIPIANSLRKIAAQDVVNKEIKEFAIKQDSRSLNNNGKLGTLEYFEIPALGIRVQLEEARKIDGFWYQRSSLAHYIGLNKDETGNIVDYLIYTNKSWRTIPYVDEIEEGMEVKFYTSKGFNALFEVSEKQLLPLERSLIVNKSERRQILLLVEDSDTNKYYGYSLVVKH